MLAPHMTNTFSQHFIRVIKLYQLVEPKTILKVCVKTYLHLTITDKLL